MLPILLTALLLGSPQSADLIIADFESPTYAPWTTTGTAFGPAPAAGTLPDQMQVTGYQGQKLANSYHGGDASTGTLTSPDFKIQRRYITFLIGGGAHAGKTCINLQINGKTVRTATGPNLNPGGSEALAPFTWDVQEFQNQTARLQIVDQATGGWGHINIDHIVQTDHPKQLPVITDRTMKITHRYLNLPVKQDAPIRKLSVLHNGTPITEFDIKLTDQDPDFWVFLDLQAHQGKTIELSSNGAPVTAIKQADEVKNQDQLYKEPLRPQLHFSSRRGWLNDPNGMVYYDGEYHLYYQHNPYGWEWGNMHWGHAVSKDLVHWKELPIALTPPTYGDMAYSGSAVVDHNNTSGWQTGDEKVIVAAYTSTGRGECIVYSTDRGRTFKEYENNPVVKHQGRDPRLLWHEPSQTWSMLLYNEDPAQERGITFYTSPDLKNWTYQSRIDGFYECPDIFQLPIDGNKNNQKWVLTAADSRYMIGEFDGKTFTPETPLLPGHQGEAYYAAQTFTNDPKGRIIQIGWRQIETPDMPFNQSMSTPLELSLKTTPDGPRLAWTPVEEFKKLALSTSLNNGIDTRPNRPWSQQLKSELNDIDLTLIPNNAKELKVTVLGTVLTYNVPDQTLTVNNRTYPVPMTNDQVTLRLITDRTSQELFANQGTLFIPLKAQLNAEKKITIETDNLSASANPKITTLKSIWQ